MKNPVVNLAESLPVLVRNSSLTISLQGWPAAVSVSVVCLSLVALAAIGAGRQAGEPDDRPPIPC